MGTTVSTIRVGQKPTEEERRQMKEEIKAAKKLPPVYDPECPPSPPQALAEFAAMARERNMKTQAVFKEYDFSDAMPNPYAEKLHKETTLP
ncbi:MAG: hypothetical protein FWG66_10795 [Spirochaetes bacterium]|nr:hypothetical protein [Spirochaetota bacterium]